MDILDIILITILITTNLRTVYSSNKLMDNEHYFFYEQYKRVTK